MIKKLIELFDAITHKESYYESVTVYVALSAFLGHLLLIFLKNVVLPTGYLPFIDSGYLSAIYTPFSILLFYEVFMLILSVPRSLVESIGKQFEIVALITLWNTLKDFAKLEHVGDLFSYQMATVQKVGLDMGGALVMFLIIALFYLVAKKIPVEKTKKHDNFVRKEKVVAFILVIIFISLAIGSSLAFFLNGKPSETQQGIHQFYQQIYTMLIFADVIGLILSFLYTSSFGIVFLYGSFVISAILTRFSLSMTGTNSIGLAIGSMLFSLGGLIVYRYLWMNVSKIPAHEE